MRYDILDIVEKQSQILFVLITNGSLMTPEKAAAIGRMQNLIVLVSKSSFLASIRNRPDLLSRDRLACSLYENFSEVEALLGLSDPPTVGNKL